MGVTEEVGLGRPSVYGTRYHRCHSRDRPVHEPTTYTLREASSIFLFLYSPSWSKTPVYPNSYSRDGWESCSPQDPWNDWWGGVGQKEVLVWKDLRSPTSWTALSTTGSHVSYIPGGGSFRCRGKWSTLLTPIPYPSLFVCLSVDPSVLHSHPPSSVRRFDQVGLQVGIGRTLILRCGQLGSGYREGEWGVGTRSGDSGGGPVYSR